VLHDIRDTVVDFVRDWSDKTDIPVCRFLPWLGIGASKFHDWKKRFGKVNEHNAWVPRDHWLTDDEKERICVFARRHPFDGYRRMTFMMLDADIVACSPASVYRVLKANSLLAGSSPNITKKGTGFVQPLKPHEHWHVDISFLNIAGTFYFVCSILDGYSRFIVHQEIREHMADGAVETIIQRAREAFPNEKPRIISDNGPQFIAKDFKEFIRITGMTHVKTSPYYPQSNGKIERWYKTLKGECIRVSVPLSLEEARRIVNEYTVYYNNVRLNSAIDYLAPKDKLEGRDKEILAARDRKLAEARERRKQLRQAQHQQPAAQSPAPRSPSDRLRRRSQPRDHGRRPAAARLPRQQHPRRSTARPLPPAWLDLRHQPLLLRQPRPKYVPLLQVRQMWQRPRTLGPSHSPNRLRRRH
jgi:putative transposase